MKEFYVCSNDTASITDKFYNGSGHATMVFWKRCCMPVLKCPAAQHLMHQNVKVTAVENGDLRQLFNFSETTSIDTIRKNVYTAQYLCRHCKEECK